MAGGEGTRPARPALRSAEQAEQLVLDVLSAHATSLLRVARRHSLCADDAHDAYQRAVEILLRHAATLDADLAFKWMHTVVKREAMAVRRGRLRVVGGEDADLDAHEADSLPSPDEQIARFDRMTRSAEALRRLKPQELRALWLRAQGHSYEEIAEITSWTYTKVNRCITEGRRTFLARYAGIESGEECRRWEPVLSAIVDGEASAADLAQARPHLRNCPACRATIRAMRESGAGLTALLPVPVATAAFATHGRTAEATSGILARLHEALAGSLQDRVAASAVKLQSGWETMSAAKLAAVAASAAAIAGGGVAVQQVVGHPVRRHVAHRAAPRRTAETAAAVVPAPPPPEPVSAPPQRPAPRPSPTAARRAEFGVKPAPKRTPASREFSAPATATAASASGAPAPARSAPRPSREARTAAREFGVG